MHSGRSASAAPSPRRNTATTARWRSRPWTRTEGRAGPEGEHGTNDVLTEKSCIAFSEALASKAAVPGGGGASALVGALGVALGHMVGALTVGKAKYATVEEDLRALMARAEDLRQRLLRCVEKDAEAFEPLSRAYAIPKDDPEREETMERCLRTAAAAPLEILDLCCEAIELQREFADKGSALAVSDAATGVVFCWSAMYGAAVNVKVNTKAMKDRTFADTINAHVDAQMAKYWPVAEKVYEDVYRRFC
ncbi:MAG: cyclodeaminase/cyclohydrolase family protein [Oscillospiraceae bacterium]|nr:cyclodeaminase/cyclohydrolase family protein [Oscillospiraceae bacterium]